MELPGQFDSNTARRAFAALASAVLHVVLFILILSGGQHDGVGSSDQPTTELVFIDAPEVDKTEGIELTPLEPSIASTLPEEQRRPELGPQFPAQEATSTQIEHGQSEPSDAPPEVTAAITPEITQPAAKFFTAAAEERAALTQRLARLAEELQKAPQTPLEWEENGKQYTAKLVWERAKDGTALEHVIAEVSASDRGKTLSTRIMLKRLAFSQFTQVVDRWDPMVQLHDDVIVGRFHSNSRFNVMHDSRIGPTFLGKVTTAARTFEMFASGRRRQSEIFRGGLETRAGRIELPDALQPFAWAPQEAEARIHELTTDTRIRFFPDGSYMWNIAGTSESEYLNAPSEHPVYFIASPGTTLYVQGAVAGSVLIYSPHRIVIEDDLTYAHDPRRVPDSRDYLGLVSDKYVEVAPPNVTGPGDLEVHAAIFAGRRFVVRDIDHPKSATLRIYGSLSAGSLSASEPRYATEIEYDSRFEQRRPPGFPFTSRYEAEDWDGRWLETSDPAAEDTF